MKILIIKPSSLGDVIHTFPAVDLIRRQFPDASIAWVVNRSLTGIVELFPAVDEIIPFQRENWLSLGGLAGLWSLGRELRHGHFDVALDLQGLLRSGVMTYLSGAPRRIGFSAARERAYIFYTERIPLPANLEHAVDKNVFLVRSAFGITAPARAPELLQRQESVRAAEQVFIAHGLTHGPVLAVAPTARWASKAWPPAFFAEVVDAAAARVPDLNCWVLGLARDRAVGDTVIGACHRATPVNLMGETNLGVLLELLRRSHALLTNDSGPMHLAAAIRLPVIALFGPTDPRLTGPYGGPHTVFRGTCERAPCFSKICARGDRICTEMIRPEAVAEAVVRSLTAGYAGAVA